MKNKKRFFNKNLYMEGLRQLKVIGILGIVINVIIAVVIPVGNCLSAKAEYHSYINSNMADQFTKYAINAVDYHVYYLLFFLVFAPLMVIILFRFLNRREDCDFYHSLPHTRQCLLLSFFASIVTWLIVQIFIVTVVSAILYQIFSNYLVLEFSRLFCFAVNILVTSLLVAAALLLACTLSGNTITGFIVFLILFFTPRIFITIYQTLMVNQLDYLANSMNSIFSIKHNLFYTILRCLSSNYVTYAEITSINSSTVFTLLMTLFLFVMAYIFFTKRKSEAAENSMNNKTLQAIFRTIFTMLLCMIPISILFGYYTERNIVFYQYRYDSTAMMIFYVVISYIAVILGMFLYELLTTKNARNALRSLKSIPLIIGLNAFVFFLLICSFGHYRNLRLDEEKIDSINIISLGHIYDYNYNQASYFEAMMARYDFTERELISLLCTAFNDYADMHNDYLDGKRETLYNMNFSVTVEFHGKSNYTFYLKLDAKTSDQFYKLLYSNEEFYNIYMNLPELTERDNIYFSSAGENNIDKTFEKELYESLKTELSESGIHPKQWIEVIDNYGIGYIVVNKYIDSVYYELRVPINLTTPKTYQKLLDYYMETHSDDLESFLNSLQNFEEIFADSSHDESNDSVNLDIIGYDSVNEVSDSIYLSTAKESQTEYESEDSYLKKCIALLKEHTKSVSNMNSEEDILIYVRADETKYTSNYAETDLYVLCIPIKIFKELNTEGFE